MDTMLSTKNVRNSAVILFTAENAGSRRYPQSNQSLISRAPALRTSFSTVCVQSYLLAIVRPVGGALLAGGVADNRCARLIVPKIEAEEIFPLKSTGLSQWKGLPHNFVHRICAEARRVWERSELQHPRLPGPQSSRCQKMLSNH